MNTAWIAAGRLSYWILKPVLAIYLSRTRRTRILMRSGDDILLVRSWLGNGQWGLPGGGLHADEPEVIGIRRELFEETGIPVESAAIQKISGSATPPPGIKPNLIFFNCQIDRVVPLKAQRFEITGCGWFPVSALPRNVTPEVNYALQLTSRL